jgi:hypothetical protein
MADDAQAGSIAGQLGKSYWHHIFLGAILLTSIVLLFAKDLPASISRYLIPSLIIYAVGTGIIGHAQGVQFRRNFGPGKWQEPKFLFTVIHLLWLAGFVWYLFHRGIL